MTLSEPTVSSGVLVYLFADQLAVPPARINIYGTVVVPCSSVEVRADDFAVRVLAAELWAMRESDAIRFDLTRRRLFFGDETRLLLALGRRRAPGGALASEVRAQIARAPVEPDENEIATVVTRWLGRQRADPYQYVRVAVERDAVAVGVFVALETDGAAVASGALTPDYAVCARLRQAHAEFPARWLAFLADEPQLASALLAGCEDALRRGRDPVVPRSTGDGD